MNSSIQLQATPSLSILSALATQQMLYVLIDAVPTLPSGSLPPVGLNLCLLLDRSGSMQGQKIAHLREAVRILLRSMSPGDIVSIVLFDDRVDTLLSPQAVGDPALLDALLPNIRERGGTALAFGLRRALQLVESGMAADRINRILLLTDGETWGDEEECKQIAAACGARGIGIQAFGLGAEWKASLLDAVAQASGGQSDYLATPDALVTGFVKAVRALQVTWVRNATLTLRLPTGVRPRAAWRVVPQIKRLEPRFVTDRNVLTPLGEIQNAVGQSVLFELMLEPRGVGAVRIAQAELEFDIPTRGILSEKIREDVIVTLQEEGRPLPPLNPRVMNLAEKVNAFKLQTRALDEAALGNRSGATQQLRALATQLLDLGAEDLALTAAQQASALEQNMALDEAAKKLLQYGTRNLGEEGEAIAPPTSQKPQSSTPAMTSSADTASAVSLSRPADISADREPAAPATHEEPQA